MGILPGYRSWHTSDNFFHSFPCIYPSNVVRDFYHFLFIYKCRIHRLIILKLCFSEFCRKIIRPMPEKMKGRKYYVCVHMTHHFLPWE